MSVNIHRIIEYRHLPARAAAAIGSLILILVTSMAALIDQGTTALGTEILLFATCGWALEFWSARRAVMERRRAQRSLGETALILLLGQIQVLPFLAGAVLLISGRSEGLYSIAGGVIAIFIFSVMNAWVLLVEILR